MKKLVIFSWMFFSFLVAYAQFEPDEKNFKLEIFDDFDFFNFDLWYKADNVTHGDYGYNIRQEEPEIYQEENVYVEDGNLVLRVMKKRGECPKGAERCQYKGIHKYSSGEILSNSTYFYGYYEISAKLPVGSGYWPAFWLWQQSPVTQESDCWYGEIDVFEAYGSRPESVESRVHCGFDCPSSLTHSADLEQHSCDYGNGYHIYGLLWLPDEITWYIDGYPVRYMINEYEFGENIAIHHPMQIILNLALATETQTDNRIKPSTPFPNFMFVDYFKYYRAINIDE